MNLEKVIFSFFMILALTLNFGFFMATSPTPIITIYMNYLLSLLLI